MHICSVLILLSTLVYATLGFEFLGQCMSGLQQFDFSNGPVVISDHYGSGPVSITSSCPWILLPKSNRNSNYCTMSFLVADFVGYFVISNNNKNNDDDDEYIFRSPTPIFKGVDGTVAYSDPTASELTFLNKDLIRSRKSGM